MDLTRFAITNNRVTAMLLVAVLAGGYSAYTTMEQAMDPGFTIRTAQIITSAATNDAPKASRTPRQTGSTPCL